MVCKFLLLSLLGSIILSANGYAKNPKILKSFVENKGQIVNQYQEPRPDIDFRLNAGNGLSVFIGDRQIHYQWAAPIESRKLKMENGNEISSADRNNKDQIYKMYRMDVELIGANPDAQLIAEGKQNYSERYFQPWVNKDNRNQGVVAYSYRKVTYKNVYPNIDWILYFKDAKAGMTKGVLEYDFEVRPGGKVSDIKIKYEGAVVKLNVNGSLTAVTPMGSITEQAPYSFQEDGKVVASQFELNGDILSFKTGDHSGTLTIDPTLEWATYFGDLEEDIAYGVCSDSTGNIYMGGVTGSVANIATIGSYQSSLAGGSSDAFLTKFNDSGDCLWSTYFGGPGEDRGTDITLNKSTGSVYIAGVTNSDSGMSSPGAYQDTSGGDYDAFLARFDTSGMMIWSTYYGGNGSEGVGLMAGVGSDKHSNVYLCGVTISDENMATAGSYQLQRAGNSDAFIAKFDSTGVRQWATYFGGSDSDWGRKISCDTSGNVYLGGYTMSSSGIATSGSFQSAIGGSNDAFLAQFNTAGNLQWSTYFGGSMLETFTTLGVANDGTVCIAGGTGSSGLATPGVHQDTLDGIMDGYLADFSTTGQLNWATYMGGEGPDFINALCIDDQAIYTGGLTASVNGISTPGTYQDTADLFPGFIVSFDHSGQRNWGTYYGGSGADWINSMLITVTQQLFIAGQTYSGTDLASPGSFQTNFGGGTWDAFLAKFNVCETPAVPGPITGDTELCSGQEYMFTIDPVPGASFYTWTIPGSWMGNSDSTSIIIIPDENNGVISATANNNCAMSDSVSLGLAVNPSPEPEIVNNNNILSTTQPYSSYQWNEDGLAINGATAATYTATMDGNYSVTVTNENGCSGTSDTIVLAGVGIDELQAIRDAVHIYPNPVADVMHIQSPVAVDVEVMSIEGRALLRISPAKEISLKALAQGIYLVRVYDEEGKLVKVKKVVKK